MNPTDRISDWLSLSDCIKSEYASRNGISNIPTPEALEALKLWAAKVYDPLCEHFKMKILTTSIYRGELLNKKIGGAKTSQHCKGEAGDLDPDGRNGITNAALYNAVKAGLVPFDQLIWEFGTDQQPAWVHISYSKDQQRGEVLRAIKVPSGKGMKTQYLKF